MGEFWKRRQSGMLGNLAICFVFVSQFLLPSTYSMVEAVQTSSLSLRDRLGGPVAFVETSTTTGAHALILDKESEELSQMLERRFKDVSSGLSLGACAKRVKNDIALSAVTALESELKTTFIFKIIMAIAVPLVMMFVTPLLIKLVTMIGKPIGDFLSPRVVKSCGNYMVLFIIPLLENTLGVYLQANLSVTLAAKLGILLMDAFVFHIPRVLGREIPPQMTNYVLRVESPVIGKEVAHRVLHTMTHSLTHSLSRSLPRLVADDVEKELSHNLVNYYYCIYCYEKGEFCNYCHAYLSFRTQGVEM
eukprot:c3379_g1_i1.p1 GENE.c3379_g1_i1~~c3379_g1_i1.p1  ORF type:complete len:305 (+),score=54.80 c3379_g1_i1:2-916(+)